MDVGVVVGRQGQARPRKLLLKGLSCLSGRERFKPNMILEELT